MAQQFPEEEVIYALLVELGQVLFDLSNTIEAIPGLPAQTTAELQAQQIQLVKLKQVADSLLPGLRKQAVKAYVTAQVAAA